MSDALILTLRFDPDAFARLDALRQAHFPDRGYRLPAHLTLFHALPGERLTEITERLDRVCADIAPFEMQATKVMDFNPGAAIRIESDRLKAVRKRLAKGWHDWLTPQDQGFHSHVTVQNKVAQADSIYDDLAAGFEPHEVTATGLLLWTYRGGPWDFERGFPFAAP